MSRQPAHVMAASTKPVGRQGIWDFICKTSPAPFRVADIRKATDIPAKTIRDYLVGLSAIGAIEPSRFVSQAYILVRNTGVEAPRVTKDGQPVTQGAAREQMWRTMKMLGEFDFHELAIAASLEATPVDHLDAKDYCVNLARAGYLRVVVKGGKKPARYRFIAQKNTGPKPPMVQRMQTVFDPNLGVIVWHPAVES